MIWWLLYDGKDVERNKRYIEMYFEKCERYGIDLKFMVEENLEMRVANEGCSFWNNGEKLDFPDAVINRTRSFRLARQLELSGCRVFNNSEITLLGNDKELALAYVRCLGVNVMPTFSENCFRQAQYPCVLKTIDGHGRTEVFWLGREEDYIEKTNMLSGKRCILQETADFGKDLRVYVIGKQIVAAMLRTSQEDFRSNFCLGGTTEIYHLSPEEKKVAEAVVNALEIDFCGIDFMFEHGKMVFNEIEDVVGSRMLYTHTDIDVVELYIEHILRKIRNDKIDFEHF